MAADPIALTNARLVDGTGAPPVGRATVLIDGGRVVDVGSGVDPPAGTRVVDVEGRTVIPGLLDGHMHVTGMPGLLDERAMLEAQLEASEILRACLQWGTTTVGHAGGCSENLVLRDMIDGERLAGRARLRVSGVVTATGGHVRGEGADGPWEIRKVARRMALEGVDFYKTTATGGFMWLHEALGMPDYTPEELAALVDEARMRHRLVHCHAHDQPGLGNAIVTGCHVILHGSYADEAAVHGMRERGLTFMPTLYITSEHSWARTTRDPAVNARLEAAHAPHRAAVARAHALGVTLATGTDGFPRPGALVHEMVELAGCGLSPHEVIVAATRNTAAALGAGHLLGTIEPGKVADCVVVDGDPLDDVAVLTEQRAIAMVVKAGVVEVDRRAA